MLFLPDRKYAPKIGHLGQDEFPVAEPEPDKDDVKDGSKPPLTDLSLLNPDVVVAEVLQEIKDLAENHMHHRGVQWDDAAFKDLLRSCVPNDMWNWMKESMDPNAANDGPRTKSPTRMRRESERASASVVV